MKNENYRSGDEETGEEVEESVGSDCQNGCYLVVWRDGDGHHSIVCEVEEGDIGDGEEPKEFLGCPFEPHHRVHYEAKIRGLNEHVWYFGDYLHFKNNNSFTNKIERRRNHKFKPN